MISAKTATFTFRRFRVTEQDFPRWAIYRKKRHRVLEYVGNGVFILLAPDDERRVVHRNQFVFLPDKPTSSGEGETKG